MQNSPDLLIITDADSVYEITHDYYPNITKSIKSGNLMVLGYEDWSNNKLIQLKSKPLCNGNDVYILNPYSNRYIQASDSEILDLFCEDKSLVVKEALVWMGAKHIIVEDEVSDKDTIKGGLKIDASTANGIGGSLNTTFSRITSVNIKNKIESEDFERKAKSFNEVKSYMQTHGLSGDTKLTLLCDRLKVDGKLSGKERYTLSYLNEVDFALKVLASINYKVFSSSLDFSLEHNHIHSITKSLLIEF